MVLRSAVYLIAWLLTTASFPLTLEEAIKVALKNNRELLSLFKQVEAEQKRFFSEKATFDWEWFAQAFTASQEAPASSELQGAAVSVQKNAGGTLGLRKLIQDGSYVQLQLNSNRQKTNSRFVQINPVFSSDLVLEYTMPLLKNRGRIARLSVDLQEKKLKLTTLKFLQFARDLVFQVQTAFLDAVFAKENVALQREELELATSFLQETKERIKAGILASTEIYSAQARLASARKNLTAAEAEYQNALEKLRTYLGGQEAKMVTMSFDFEKKELEEQKLVEEALANRIELDILKKQIDQLELQLKKAENDEKLKVDLSFMFGANGVKRTQAKSLSEAKDFDFLKWQVGLQVASPFGNRKAFLNAQALRAEKEQRKLKLQQAKLNIEQEVKAALRQYRTALKTYEEAKLKEKYLAEVAEAESEKLKVGLSTPFLVQQANKEYLAAKVATLQSKIAIHKAFFYLEKVTGRLRHQLEKALFAASAP